jgi:predicted SpoU family rRNA methylase
MHCRKPGNIAAAVIVMHATGQIVQWRVPMRKRFGAAGRVVAVTRAECLGDAIHRLVRCIGTRYKFATGRSKRAAFISISKPGVIVHT